MVIAAIFANRAQGEEFFKKLVPALEAAWAHPARRAHALGGIFGERYIKRSILAAQKTRGGERLQLLTLADIETLSDIDKSRHRWIERTECSGNNGAEVWRRHRLRWRVTRVPLILMSGMKNETQVARRV